eukprot:COSAG01_NODE_4784_length_4746_cov_239.649236_5_plen_78_part_00
MAWTSASTDAVVPTATASGARRHLRDGRMPRTPAAKRQPREKQTAGSTGQADEQPARRREGRSHGASMGMVCKVPNS